MRQEILLTGIAVVATYSGVLWSENALADDQRLITDVELSDGGQLLGRVHALQGEAIPGTIVALRYSGVTIATVRSDENGRFAFSNVRGGIHSIVWPGQSKVVRVWSKGNAPAVAVTAVALVADGSIVRGQTPYMSPFNTNSVNVSGEPPLTSGHSNFGGSSGPAPCNTCVSNGACATCAPANTSVVCGTCAPSGSAVAVVPAAGSRMLNVLALTTVGTSVAALSVSIDNRRILRSAVASGTVGCRY